MTQTIQPSELKQALDSGVRYQLIDVRNPDEFADAHVPVAVNLPMHEVEARLDDLNRQDPVVLICQSGRRAHMTCDLITQHRKDVMVLDGGTAAWQQAGLPVVQTRSARLALMRQVQLIVGPLVLAGSALAILVNPNWAILSGLIGAGLTFAGATGWCGMAILLAKMPWNRSKGASTSEAPTPTSCCN